MSQELHIIFLTDIHGAGHLLPNLLSDISAADLVVLSGDITHFGRRREVKAIIGEIEEMNNNILAVSGNCDYPEVDEYLTEKGISIHRKIVRKNAYTIAGLGGSLPCPGTTPNEFTETEAQTMLNDMESDFKESGKSILVSHQPPYNTLNDRLDYELHVGSNSLRNFIENTRPMLCLTGHIHEGIGTDRIGNCQVVNPGPFRNGNYACIHCFGENSVNVTLKQITA